MIKIFELSAVQAFLGVYAPKRKLDLLHYGFKTNILLILISLISIFCFNVCPALEICPATFATEQHAATVPENYQATRSNNTPNNLWMIWFSDRNPIFNSWLRASNANNTMEIWEFRQFGPKLDLWVSCFYTNTSLSLVQKLPNSLSSCTIKYFDAKHDQIEGMPIIKSASCK